MKLPEGITEKQFIETLDNVVHRVAHKFLFPGQTKEDLMQQGRVFAIQAMNKGKFDESKGNLESFLYTHVHNRLHNFKRDNYERTDLPCLKCPFKAYDPYKINSCSGCTKYNDLYTCGLFKEWRDRNDKKKYLCGSVASESFIQSSQEPSHTPNMEDILYAKGVIKMVDENVSLELRRDWIRMKNGNSISNGAKSKLIAEIRKIIGLDEEEIDDES